MDNRPAPRSRPAAWRVIRPGRPDDLPFLVAMLREAVSWDPAGPAWSTEATLAHPEVARYVSGWGRPGDVAMVAVDGSARPLGAAWYRRFDPDRPGYGFLHPSVPELALGVASARRRQGIGWALLWALLFEAAGSGVPALSLSVAGANPAARLYRRVGFLPVAEADGSCTMRRDLVRLPQLEMTWPVARLGRPAVRAPDGYALRTFRPGDEPRFYELMAQAGWPGWDGDRLRPWAARVPPDGWIVAVDAISGQVVASAMGVLDDAVGAAADGELGWVAADPGRAGRGLGAAVAAAATARLVDLGCRRIHLRSEDFRLAALRTYLRIGYAPVLDRPEVVERWTEISRRVGWPLEPAPAP
jgi:mycothiol synthase